MKGKKVLVTGGSGFIPSHLTKRLVDLGAEVYVLNWYNCVNDNVRLSSVWDKIHFVEGDIRNTDDLKQIKDIAPEIVYHLAAYNHVGGSWTRVQQAIDSNTKGTANLMEAYDDYKKFIYMSTSEIYGEQDSVPFKEDFTPHPISPYAVGKYGGELYARMKYAEHKLPVVIVRCFNAFGPYQSMRAVIPEMIINALMGRPLVTTKGEQTREFNYVANLVDGLILAGEKDKAVGEIINVCAQEEIKIKDLVKKIHELSNSKSELKIGALPYRPTEIWRMYGDNEKAKKILGWKPKIGFGEGLKKTIAWYKEYVKVFKTKNSELNKLSEGLGY